MNFGFAHFSRRQTGKSLRRRAFTLLEIMIVVGIMGVILAAGVPTLYKMLHKEGFRKSVSDIVEVCNSARARAIMQGTVTEVVFHPQQRTCEVQGGSVGGGWAHSARIDDSARVEMLDVNLREYKDTEIAKVRFFPNGTSDEMTLILVSDRNEWNKISIEVTTGLASVATDPSKWK